MFCWSTLHSLTMAVSVQLITERKLRSLTRVQAYPPPSCSLRKFTLKSNAMIIEPLSQPIQAPKQGQLCLIKGKTQNNSWSGAWPCGKPTAGSVVVFEAQHGGDQLRLRNFRGGTVPKLETFYLPKKHLELLGGDQLTLRSFRGVPVQKLETFYLPKKKLCDF